jgi:hypothetical protein
VRIKFLLFYKLPSLGYFVTVAQVGPDSPTPSLPCLHGGTEVSPSLTAMTSLPIPTWFQFP